MTDLKKIVTKVFILLLDIVLLTIRIITHIVLPNRKRKGNILNSVFVFFVGTVEILNRFEYGIFQMAKIFKHKYIRKGVIVISTFLFLLSSFEWANGQEVNIRNDKTNTVQLQAKVSRSVSIKKATNSIIKSFIAAKPSIRNDYYTASILYLPSIKKYILFRNILI
ncbi:MAG: hypothetical protein ABI148_05195 [Ginsengibacter sp.]